MYTHILIGNFGGKHSHRKDPKGTVNCLQKIETKLFEKKKYKKNNIENLKYEIYMNNRKISRNLQMNSSINIDKISDNNDTTLSNSTMFIKNMDRNISIYTRILPQKGPDPEMFLRYLYAFFIYLYIYDYVLMNEFTFMYTFIYKFMQSKIYICIYVYLNIFISI
jgi:hypothetical protein